MYMEPVANNTTMGNSFPKVVTPQGWIQHETFGLILSNRTATMILYFITLTAWMIVIWLCIYTVTDLGGLYSPLPAITELISGGTCTVS